MKITKLYIENFKSFDKTEIIFGDVNLFIGANASGKSNLIELFELLKDIKYKGLYAAVSEHGGMEALKNMKSDSRSFSTKIELEVDKVFQRQILSDNHFIGRKRDRIIYEIEFTQKGDSFTIEEDITFFEYFAEFEGDKITPLSNIFEYGLKNRAGKFETRTSPIKKTSHLSTGIEAQIDFESPFSAQFMQTLYADYGEKSILEHRIFIPKDLFDFGVYDIIPFFAKQTNPYHKNEMLSKNASNLTEVVYSILKKGEDTSEQFVADVAGLLPFIQDIKVQRFESNLYLQLQEKYNPTITGSRLISNGTVSIIAIIIALY